MKLIDNLKILGLVSLVACWSGIAMADINIVGYGNTLIQTPVFGDDLNPSGNMLRFDYDQTGDQSSLGTCAMNPMSSNFTESVIDELPIEEPDTFVAVQDYAHSFKNSEIASEEDTRRPRPYYKPDDEVEETPNVPEPATLLIVGLGLAGVVPFTRRLRRK